MAEVVEALEGSIAPIECISEGSDGSIVCSRESEPGPRLPDQAAVDARALLDRAHAAGDDARRPRPRPGAAGRPGASERPGAAGAATPTTTPHDWSLNNRPWPT